MFIGPLSFSFFHKKFQDYKNKLSKKEHYNESNPTPQRNDTGTVAVTVAGVLIGFFILYLVLLGIWIWNLVLVCIYWNRLPVIAKVIGILGIVSGVFPVISIIVIYSTKHDKPIMS